MTDLATTLRRAITSSGLTHYALAKLAKVDYQRIDAFMAGKDLRLASASKLARALGLELRKRARKQDRF